MTQPADPKKIDKWRHKIGDKFESKGELLIPILQYVQSLEGYLPPEAMEATARHLRLPASKVYGVASFYAQFNFTPQGRNKLTVCRGTACHVRGSGKILNDLERHLGIAAGETTDDLGFTLKTVACFGSCALAPVVVVNEGVHGRQTSDMIKRVINGLDKGGKTTEKPAGAKKASTKKKTATESKKTAPAPRKRARSKAGAKKAASGKHRRP